MDKNDILKLNKSEIEKLLNDSISKFNKKDSSASDLRYAIFEKVQKSLPYLNINFSRTDYSEGSFQIGKINITFKITCKNTDQIEKLTKLKSAFIKIPGKIKVSSITVHVPSISIHTVDENKTEIEVEDGMTYMSSGVANNVDLTHYNIPLKELLSREILIEEFQKQSSDSWKDIRDGIGQDMIQDFIKKHWQGDNLLQPKTYKGLIPDKYIHLLVNLTIDNLFPILSDIFVRMNPRTYNQVKELMFDTNNKI